MPQESPILIMLSFVLLIITEPDPPRSVILTATSYKCVKIMWESPGNSLGEIRSYQVSSHEIPIPGEVSCKVCRWCGCIAEGTTRGKMCVTRMESPVVISDETFLGLPQSRRDITGKHVRMGNSYFRCIFGTPSGATGSWFWYGLITKLT